MTKHNPTVERNSFIYHYNYHISLYCKCLQKEKGPNTTNSRHNNTRSSVVEKKTTSSSLVSEVFLGTFLRA